VFHRLSHRVFFATDGRWHAVGTYCGRRGRSLGRGFCSPQKDACLVFAESPGAEKEEQRRERRLVTESWSVGREADPVLCHRRNSKFC
jgi:hypothetical protein